MYVEVYFDHGDRTCAPSKRIINRSGGQSSTFAAGLATQPVNNAGAGLSHTVVVMVPRSGRHS
jgi:hypothetical protein